MLHINVLFIICSVSLVCMQLFRKDLISAMKLPDTEVLQYDEYFLITDTWKLEWERGVQVPVDPDAIPPLVVGLVILLLVISGRAQIC